MKNQIFIFKKIIKALKNEKDGVSNLFIQKVIDAQKKSLTLEVRK